MESKLASLSKRIYHLLGMSGYARLDYRVTEQGEAYLLEANPNPQIAKDEDFALSAKYMGIEYLELIEQLEESVNALRTELQVLRDSLGG